MRAAFITVIAVAAAGVATAAPRGPSATQFLTKAIEGDNSEIHLGQLAVTQGGSQEAKTFGQTLVTDHTTAKQQALPVAQKLGVTPPGKATPEADHEYRKLQGMHGAAFDHEFATYMVKDHEKDISDFKTEAAGGSGPAAALAKQTIPTLEKHLAMAKRLAASGH
ncbi:MAG TPA: DUF4142 domain-containing protein [Caulobacteraceae bacterium]|jgi:putative membrane protein|nr:DUF4142 domain-containing protein [Caulobacteraceae bacterium]